MPTSCRLAPIATAALIDACGDATAPIDHHFFNELLLMGADINAVCPVGETPLIRAAASGALDKVEYLISCGADLTRPHAADGRTAYAIAADKGHALVARTLMTAGDYLRRQFDDAVQHIKPVRTPRRSAIALRVIK